MKRVVFQLLICLVALPSSLVWAQNGSIRLENPSFEGVPRNSTLPAGWVSCGFPNESDPDIQPYGGWEVTNPAQEGKTYIGMVTRDDDTWEAIGQRLSAAFKGGECYNFSIYLSQSDIYKSATKRLPTKIDNFTKPIRLRVFGGFSLCDKRELLGETGTVAHKNWKKYDLKLKPSKDYTHIVLEAYYETPVLFPYNGNLLMDNASALTLCEQPAIVQNTPPTKKEPTPIEPEPVNPLFNPTVAQIFSADLDEKNIKEGQVLRVDNLAFKADSASLDRNSYAELDKLYDFLRSNPTIYVEVGGHTNGLPDHDFCDKLSAARAKTVADYLIAQGIERERITYKGYGKRNPIASNETVDGRRRNQRVEVKILRIKG